MEWRDGSPLSGFTYWADGEPGNDTRCVQYSDVQNKWDVCNCREQKPYLCERAGKLQLHLTDSKLA